MAPAALLAALLVAGGAQAQHSHGGHGAAPMSMQAMNEADLATLRPLKGRAFDVKFAQLMINHHRMAVDMAKVALKKATDGRVKKNAQQVIAAQTREIAQMAAWLRGWKASVPGPAQTSFAAPQGSTERWFLTEMIPHHQGAVDMARLAQTRSQNRAVLNLAAAILKTQQAEIEQYRAWLKSVK